MDEPCNTYVTHIASLKFGVNKPLDIYNLTKQKNKNQPFRGSYF